MANNQRSCMVTGVQLDPLDQYGPWDATVCWPIWVAAKYDDTLVRRIVEAMHTEFHPIVQLDIE